MGAEELIGHPSIQREFKRLRALGAKVEVMGQRIILSSEIKIPRAVLESFTQRIRALDSSHQLEITVR